MFSLSALVEEGSHRVVPEASLNIRETQTGRAQAAGANKGKLTDVACERFYTLLYLERKGLNEE